MTAAAGDAPPYRGLDPDTILAAVESAGFRCDGTFLALNSYENRVYQVGIEDAEPLVAKFYRPGRWSDAAIGEEHAFVAELAEREIPVVPALRGPGGECVHSFGGYRFSLYPRRGGRQADIESFDNLLRIGRYIGRIHAVGALRPFAHRPVLDIERFGERPVAWLLDNGFVPDDLRAAWESVARSVLERVRHCFDRAGEVRSIRLHGDCHAGNLLEYRDEIHFVDFDDCRMGPAVQDLWMLLSGDRAAMTAQLAEVLDGYSEFFEFHPRELHLVEALRSLRMLHYSAWLARRWHDPAFPAAFPWFNTQRYWEDQVLALREQIALMDEPPLVWGM